MKKGPLVKVQIRPGQFVKMYEADAIQAGHLPPKNPPAAKSQPPASNKMRLPEEDKTSETTAPAADFTTIPGIGPAAARVLAAHGITAFDQLLAAGELDYLPEKVNHAIAEWRAGEGSHG